MLRFLAAVVVMLFFASTNLSAQADTTTKCCCKMKKGKMMCMKDGKETAMKNDTTMKDGTKCMVNGECIMKDGKKMKMKEGDCMNTNGKMGKCDHKPKKDKKSSAAYVCPMHPEVTSDKAAKCSKCGMDLEKKK